MHRFDFKQELVINLFSGHRQRRTVILNKLAFTILPGLFTNTFCYQASWHCPFWVCLSPLKNTWHQLWNRHEIIGRLSEIKETKSIKLLLSAKNLECNEVLATKMEEYLDIAFISIVIFTFVIVLVMKIHRLLCSYTSRKKFVHSDYWGSYGK